MLDRMTESEVPTAGFSLVHISLTQSPLSLSPDDIVLECRTVVVSLRLP